MTYFSDMTNPITTKSNSWITFPRPTSQANLRLFCFPYAGGGSSVFRGWAEKLLPEIELCSVQLPGRENRIRESPFKDFFSLVQALAEVLLPYLNSPYAFFGHSMGGRIIFELSRYFRKQGAPIPKHLFVSACRAPQMQDPPPPIHNLPDMEFIERVTNYGCASETVLRNPEVMELFLPLLRADLAVVESYVYTCEAPLDCPITALGGLQDKIINRKDLNGWCEQTKSTFTLRMFPGNHFFINSQRGNLLNAIHKDLMRLSI